MSEKCFFLIVQRGRLGLPTAPRPLPGFDGVQAPPGTADGGSSSQIGGFSRPPSSTGGDFGTVADYQPSSSSVATAVAADGCPKGPSGGRILRFGGTASSAYSEQQGATLALFALTVHI